MTIRGQLNQGGWDMIRTCCNEQGGVRFDVFAPLTVIDMVLWDIAFYSLVTTLS